MTQFPKQAEPSSASDKAQMLLSVLQEQQSDDGLKDIIELARSRSDGTTQKADPKALARGLLARLDKKNAPPKLRVKGPMSAKLMRATIATLLDGDRLHKEHPAIIAEVIKRQSRETQKRVLKALPRPIAVSVKSALMHRST